MSGLAVVTGGAGFIGHHLVSSLLALDRQVRVIDDLSTGKLHHVPDGAEFINGDVRSVDRDAYKGAEVVFHLACNPSVHWSIRNPDGARASVARGTLAVLEAAASRGVRKLVLASSCSVYGDIDRPGPASPYAAAKLEAERHCQEFDSLGYIHTSCLRIFNAYGSGQHEAFAVPAMIRAALEERPITVNGDGIQTRDFVHVGTVVQAFLSAENVYTPVPVDVATGRSTSIGGLAREIRTLTSSTSAIIATGAALSGESRFAQADVREMLMRLNLVTPVKLQSGLRMTIAAMKGKR